jgi:hypothetical protein
LSHGRPTCMGGMKCFVWWTPHLYGRYEVFCVMKEKESFLFVSFLYVLTFLVDCLWGVPKFGC